MYQTLTHQELSRYTTNPETEEEFNIFFRYHSFYHTSDPKFAQKIARQEEISHRHNLERQKRERAEIDRKKAAKKEAEARSLERWYATASPEEIHAAEAEHQMIKNYVQSVIDNPTKLVTVERDFNKAATSALVEVAWEAMDEETRKNYSKEKLETAGKVLWGMYGDEG